MDLSLLFQAIGTCVHNLSTANGLYLGLFMAGLLGGFMHCTTMCGPFILSQTHKLIKLRQAALLPYHLGRITTYIFLAVLFSSFLNLAFLFAPIRSYIIAPLLFTAALLFVLMAFPSLARFFPFLSSIYFSLPMRFLSAPLQKLQQAAIPSGLHQYSMGLLLGFMPCGLIVAAIMAAATAPSPLISGVAMSFFGLGTLPALLSVAFFGQTLKQKFPKAMSFALRGMMIWSALWLFGLAGYMII
jgi:sulfite exporter TauE/SafE